MSVPDPLLNPLDVNDLPCRYKEEYQDHTTRKNEIFHCPEKRIDGKEYCIFHETYSPKDETVILEMQNRLITLINTAIENNEDLKFIGFSIPNLCIQKRRFPKNVYLNNAKFYRNVVINENYFYNFSLNNSKFECEDINISKNTFLRKVYVNDANFKGNRIHFLRNDFYGNETNFNRTMFNAIQEIDFSNSNFFSQNVYFQLTIFTSQQAINFANCIFLGQIYFQTRFFSKQLVIFSFSKFLGTVTSFAGCQFYNRGVTFNQVKFYGADAVIGFMDMIFSCKEVSFHKIQCFGSIQFERSQFNLEKSVDFDYSKFFNESNFNECKFSKGIITFKRTNFKSLLFNNAVFSNVNFDKTEFNNGDFSHTKFLEKAYFFDCKCKDFLLFHYTIFEQPQKIIFQIHDLSNFSFLRTDITRIVFHEDTQFWKKKNDLYKTYDERVFDSKFKKVNQSKAKFELGDLLSLYRNLRENYEYRLRYDIAGKFFIREMELKRKYRKVRSIPISPKRILIRKILHHLKILRYIETETDSYIVLNNWWRRNYFSLTGIYRLISNYGESLTLAIIFITIIFFLFTFFWVSQPDPLTTNPSIFQYKEFDQLYNQTQWTVSMKRSISDLIPFLPFKIEQPSNYDYFLKLIGALSFGIVFITLRRKFERRFRH